MKTIRIKFSSDDFNFLPQRWYSNILRYSLVFISSLAPFANGVAATNSPLQLPLQTPNKSSSNQIPKCPKQGLLLPETYPVALMSVSDEGGYLFMKTMVEKMFEAQSDNPPLIFINSKESNFNRLIADKYAFYSNKQNLLSRLVWVHAKGQTEWDGEQDATLAWQQDIYKGSFDPNTGQPIARIMYDYPAIGDLPQALEREFIRNKINIGKGLNLKSLFGDPHNGSSGGNLDMLPSGVCTVGDADFSDGEWSKYSKDVCGNSNQILKAPTNWLRSFHVDQILRLVPNKKNVDSCNFALLVASPDKAIELLKAQSIRETKSINKGILPEAAFDYKYKMNKSDFDMALTHQVGAGLICSILRNFDNKTPLESNTYYLRDGKSQITYNTYAGYLSREQGGQFSCPDITYSDMYKAVKDEPNMKEFNSLVQSKMNQFKIELKNAMKQSLPKCDIKIIDVPELFTGRILIDPNGNRQPAPGTEYSGEEIFPNPVNSLVLGDKVIFPEPYVRVFKDYLKDKMNELGVKADFVDTLALSEGLGNVHCATQTLRYCSP